MVGVTEEQAEAERRTQAEATLPDSLQQTFEQLVEDYVVSAKIHTGEVVIEYKVLSDLVRGGWRRVD